MIIFVVNKFIIKILKHAKGSVSAVGKGRRQNTRLFWTALSTPTERCPVRDILNRLCLACFLVCFFKINNVKMCLIQYQIWAQKGIFFLKENWELGIKNIFFFKQIVDWFPTKQFKNNTCVMSILFKLMINNLSISTSKANIEYLPRQSILLPHCGLFPSLYIHMYINSPISLIGGKIPRNSREMCTNHHILKLLW